MSQWKWKQAASLLSRTLGGCLWASALQRGPFECQASAAHESLGQAVSALQARVRRLSHVAMAHQPQESYGGLSEIRIDLDGKTEL